MSNIISIHGRFPEIYFVVALEIEGLSICMRINHKAMQSVGRNPRTR